MATFTIDPTNPDFVYGPQGQLVERAALGPQDVVLGAQPAPAPTPAAPAPAPLTAQSVLAKLDQVPRSGAQLPVSGVTTTTQRGVAPSVLNPALNRIGESAERQAVAVEQAGEAKAQRGEQQAMARTAGAYGQYSQATVDQDQARQRAEIARKNELALSLEKDPDIDPDRYISQMSTGDTITTVILAALNGAFKGMTGQKGNDVIDILDKRIDQDIAAQKEAIQSGRIRRGNLVAYFQGQGLREEEAARAARSTAWTMLDRMTEAEAQRIGAGDARSDAALVAQQIRSAADAKKEELRLSLGTDRSTTTVQREVPKGGGLKDLVEAMKAGRDAQQLQRSGLLQEEYDKQAEKVVERGEKARDFKNAVEDLASSVGVTVTRDANGNVIVAPRDGEPNTGFGFLGSDSGFWASDKRNEVTRAFSRVQRSDVMSMIREPSAALQNKFAAATERPFLDGDIIGQIKDLAEIAYRSENDSVAGFNNVVVQDYRSRVGAGPGGATNTLRPRGQ